MGTAHLPPACVLPCWVPERCRSMVTFPLALPLWGCDINKSVQFHCDQLLSGETGHLRNIWHIPMAF